MEIFHWLVWQHLRATLSDFNNNNEKKQRKFEDVHDKTESRFLQKKMLSMLFSYVFLTLIDGFSTRNFHYTCFYVLILKAAPFITCNIPVNKTTGKLMLVLVFFFTYFSFTIYSIPFICNSSWIVSVVRSCTWNITESLYLPYRWKIHPAIGHCPVFMKTNYNVTLHLPWR